MADHPFDEVVAEADKLIARGDTVWQKFTCSNCKSRQTMEQKNTFYTEGICEECGHTTDIKKQGCNYILLMKTKRLTN